jgi:hypothetical protein
VAVKYAEVDPKVEATMSTLELALKHLRRYRMTEADASNLPVVAAALNAARDYVREVARLREADLHTADLLDDIDPVKVGACSWCQRMGLPMRRDGTLGVHQDQGWRGPDGSRRCHGSWQPPGEPGREDPRAKGWKEGMDATRDALLKAQSERHAGAPSCTAGPVRGMSREGCACTLLLNMCVYLDGLRASPRDPVFERTWKEVSGELVASPDGTRWERNETTGRMTPVPTVNVALDGKAVLRALDDRDTAERAEVERTNPIPVLPGGPILRSTEVTGPFTEAWKDKPRCDWPVGECGVCKYPHVVVQPNGRLVNHVDVRTHEGQCPGSGQSPVDRSHPEGTHQCGACGTYQPVETGEDVLRRGRFVAHANPTCPGGGRYPTGKEPDTRNFGCGTCRECGARVARRVEGTLVDHFRTSANENETWVNTLCEGSGKMGEEGEEGEETKKGECPYRG